MKQYPLETARLYGGLLPYKSKDRRSTAAMILQGLFNYHLVCNAINLSPMRTRTDLKL